MTPTIVIACQDAHLQLARVLTGSKDFSAHARAVALYDGPDTADDTLLAIFVFDHPDGEGGAVMHLASFDQRWLQRAALREVHQFVSGRMGIERVKSPIDARRKETIAAALRAGYEFDGAIEPSAIMPKGGIMLSMEFSACPLLRAAPPVEEAETE